jgi:hypothetical protein
MFLAATVVNEEVQSMGTQNAFLNILKTHENIFKIFA